MHLRQSRLILILGNSTGIMHTVSNSTWISLATSSPWTMVYIRETYGTPNAEIRAVSMYINHSARASTLLMWH